MASKGLQLLGTAAVLVGLAAAAQPGAVRPVRAPMRDLVWGKLNFLHTTDTHGWHAGHLQESQYSADWGDYVSFAHHMRRKADERGVDLLLVDTGDRVEGNGLYDASHPKGQYTYDIYREQHVDIICTGNHELYIASTADREHDKTVPNFHDTYVASNLDYISPKTGERKAMAQRYRKFKTKNQKLDIVAFGFLFDFTGNANNTVVQPVRETVREPWFQRAVRENPDVFVVIGHVGVQMPEFKVIFAAIRQQNPLTPILFFGGHVHIRDATSYDSHSFAIASGRYFETIGWMSVDGSLNSKSAPSFHRRYIDNNVLGLQHHAGRSAETFPTDHGRNVTAMITKARTALNLDSSFGCAPQDYWMTRKPYPHKDSIYTLLEKDVLPSVAVNPSRKDVPRLVILNTGAIRFDVFKGPFTIDTTFIISPFLSVFRYLPDVPYAAARKVLDLLNGAGQIMEDVGLDSRYMAIPEQWAIKESIVYSKTAQRANGLQKPMTHGDDDEDGDSSKEPMLVKGYTTRDDIGTDGDDAVHSSIDFHVVPNCIQAEINLPGEDEPEPQTVDLVFFDFIEPWVLMALKLNGLRYGKQDVQSYVDGTFTELFAGWIKENWPKKCGDN